MQFVGCLFPFIWIGCLHGLIIFHQMDLFCVLEPSYNSCSNAWNFHISDCCVSCWFTTFYLENRFINHRRKLVGFSLSQPNASKFCVVYLRFTGDPLWSCSGYWYLLLTWCWYFIAIIIIIINIIQHQICHPCHWHSWVTLLDLVYQHIPHH